MSPFDTYSDQVLSSLLKEGSRDAFETIYHRYKGVLHIHAYKKLGNLQEAQDLIQDLFVSMWQKKTLLPENGNISGYLYIALKNRILDIIAHKKVQDRYVRSLDVFISEANFITDRQVRERELTLQIERAIAELPAKMQEVFILSRTRGMSYKEIAEQLGISEATVKNHIKAALRQLRQKLGFFVYLLFLLR